MKPIETKVIPPMTHPLGQHWQQPKKEDISLSLRYAWMTMETFRKLCVYQTSTPIGVYAGKMWRMQAYTNRYPPGHPNSKHEWLLCWYQPLGEFNSRDKPIFIVDWIIIQIEP